MAALPCAFAFAASAPAGSFIVNRAVVSYEDANGNPRPAVSTTSVTEVSGGPVGTVSLEDSPDPVSAGGRLNYTLRYANTGNAQGTGATLLLEPPPLLSTATLSASGGGVYVPALGKVRWDLGALAAGGTGSVTVGGTVPAGTAAGVVAAATATLSCVEGCAAAAAARTTVGEGPNLELSLSAAQAAVLPGGTIAYTIAYRNGGNRVAEGVLIQDAVPSGAAYEAGTATDGGALGAGRLSWSIGSVAAGASGSVRFQTRVSTLAVSGSSVRNVASALYAGGAATSNEAVTLVSDPGVSIILTPSTTSVQAGGRLAFTCEFTNDPLLPLSGLVIRSSVPAGTTFMSADNGGVLSGDEVVWTMAPLQAGERRALRLEVQVAPGVAAGTVITGSARATAPDMRARAASGAATVTAVLPGGVAFTDAAGSPKNSFRPGQTVYVQLSDSALDTDPSAAETFTVTVSVGGLDSETLVLVETGPNTGIFRAGLPSVPGPAAAVGDASLTLAAGESLKVLFNSPLGAVVYEDVALIDPFGVVFNSVTGAPVAGAQVSLVDSITGLVVPLPLGQVNPAVTGADGRYAYPFVPVGNYRLEVSPGAGFRYPSILSTSDMAAGFVIGTGSKREAFPVAAGMAPINLDLPVDPDPASLRVAKACDRSAAATGDVVQYTVTVTNTGASPTRSTRLSDDLPHDVRYIGGSTRINGVPAADPEVRGGVLGWSLPDVAPGAPLQLIYKAVLGVDSPRGDGINRATARAVSLNQSIASNTAAFTLKITEGVFTSRGTVFGKVFVDADGDGLQGRDEPGVPDAVLFMEDGTRVATDKEGKYSIPLVPQGAHVLRLDEASLPEGLAPAGTGAGFWGADSSRALDVVNGGLQKANFPVRKAGPAVSTPSEAVVGVSSVPAQGVEEDAFSTEALEKRILDMSPELGFLHPADGALVESRLTNVIVRAPFDAELGLSAGGRPVGADRIGRRITSEASRVALVEYIGVELEPGATNVLLAEVRDPFGNLRGSAALSLATIGEASRISLVPERVEASADGRSELSIEASVEDAEGRRVRSADKLSVSASMGTVLNPDADPDAAGVQIPLQDGRARIRLRAPEAPGGADVSARFGAVTERSRIRFAPHVRDMFAAGLGELKLGYGTSGGGFRPPWPSRRMKDDVFMDRRLAFFSKGRLWRDIQLTASYDSEKVDKNELFRSDRTDTESEDRYPLYGDASRLGFETASSGKLYLRLEKGPSSLLLGDFQTDLRGTKLGAYQRSFNGGKLDLDGGWWTVKAHASRTDYTKVVDVLRGKGVSGYYYLSRSPVVEGSERVTLEVRDRFNPEVVIERKPMSRDADYIADYAVGTLLFKWPVTSYASDYNPVYLVVSYESRGGSRDQNLYGGRASLAPASWLEVGGTGIVEESLAGDYRLGGADLTLKLPRKSFVRAEFSETSSLYEEGAGFGRKGGRAWLVEGEAHPLGALSLTGSYRRIGDWFNNPSALEVLRGVEKYQAGLGYALSRTLSLTAGYAQEEDRLNDTRRQTESAGLEKRWGETVLKAEAVNEVSTKRFLPAGLPTTRAPFDFSEELADRQTSGRLSARAKLWRGLSGTLEQRQDLRDADFGTSQAGLEYEASRHAKLYVREMYDRFGSREETRTTLGVETRLLKNTVALDEYRLSNAGDGSRMQQALGLRNTVPLTRTLSGSLSLEHVKNLRGAHRQSEPEAFAAGAGLEYLPSEITKVTGRAEYRKQSAVSDSWLGELNFARSLNADYSLLLRSRAFYEDFKAGGLRVTMRDQVGLAYRPADRDGFNALSKVERRTGRSTMSGSEKLTEAYIFSGEAVLQPARRLQLTGRYAGKWVTDYGFDSYVDLAALRAVLDLGRRFDLAAEYRLLTSHRDMHRAHGGYAEVGYSVLKGLCLSTGYAFDRFDGDLTEDSSWGGNVYLKLRLKFDESLLRGSARK